MRKLTVEQQKVYDALLKHPMNSYKLQNTFSGKSWSSCINNMIDKYIKRVQRTIDQRWNTDYLNEKEKEQFDKYISSLDEKKAKRISSIFIAKIN